MTYEYKCLSCDFKWNHEAKITEEPLKECPHCSGRAKRLISLGTGFQLKGGGWARDNYS